VHVAHTGPDGNLGAGADARVLLEEGSPGDLQLCAEKVGVDIGPAGYGGLYIESVAETGQENGSADRSG